MFLYMITGYILFRTEKITLKGIKDMATLLVWLIIPVMIVNSFCIPYSPEKLRELAVSALAGALCLAVAVAVAMLVFRKDPIANFGCVFSNAGFIGIPLVQAALGDRAVFWLVGLIVMLNLLGWSYGARVITGERSALKLKNLLLNPMMIAGAIGLLIFVTGLGAVLPEVVTTAVSGMASINAPLAMMVLGTYLAQSDIRKMIGSAHLYWVCAVRLLIIPAVTMALFSLIPFDRSIMLAVLIASATPVGVNVAVYAQIYDSDYPYACQAVTLSTLLSVVTLPLVMLMAETIL